MILFGEIMIIFAYDKDKVILTNNNTQLLKPMTNIELSIFNECL